MSSATDNFQAEQYLSNDGILANFMSATQRFVLKDLIKGEEGDYFIQKVLEIVKIIRGTPVTYNTEDQEAGDKVAYLHYFRGGVDAWIVERDVGDTPDGNGEGEQLQAFGKIGLYGGVGADAEWGYISIKELIEAGVELDLNWTPKKMREVK